VLADEEATSARDALLGRTSELLGSVKHRRVDRPEYTRFRLGLPPGADYAFSVWIYDDGEPQISARLPESAAGETFWSRHFELPDYPDVTSRNLEFLEVLDRIVSWQTRITQARGWLAWSFQCHALVGTEWVPVGGVAAAKWLDVRDRSAKEKEYFSPPLRGCEGAVEQGQEADER